MRIAVVDSCNTKEAAQNTDAIVSAYRLLGHDVIHVDYRMMESDEVVKRATKVRPEYIHMGKCERLAAHHVRAMRHGGVFISHSYLDYRPCGIEDWVVALSREVDVTYLGHTNSDYTSKMIERGARRIGYTTEGVNLDDYVEPPDTVKFDFVFMGSNQRMALEGYSFRREVIDYARSKYRVRIHGAGWDGALPFVTGKDYIRAVQSARFCIDVHSCFHLPGATSRPRTLRYLLSGRQIIGKYHPSIYEEFPEIIRLNSVQDIDKVVVSDLPLINRNNVEAAKKNSWPEILKRHIADAEAFHGRARAS